MEAKSYIGGRQTFNKRKIYGISMIAVLGGLLFGYDTAVISGTVESLNKFFVLPFHLEEKYTNSLLGFIVSSALIGCILGGMSGGYLSEKLGRKKSLILAAVLFIISCIGSSWPEIGFAPFGKGDHTVLTQFIIYRVIGGIGIGIASILSPMYIAEVAPAGIRGRLVAWYQMAIVIGILLVYFVNYFIAKAGQEWLHDLGWRWMFASEFIPAVLFLLLLWFIPESPRWLALKGKNKKALEILTNLNDENSAKIEMEAIKGSLKQHSGKLLSFGVTVLIIGVLISAFQQLVGINVMIYYAPEIFKNMGNSNDSAMFQTILIGATNLIATLAAIHFVDKLGRRLLLLLGSILMTCFMFVVGFSFYFQSFGIISLIAVLGFVGAFSLSWGPVAWVLLSEIFPNTIRGKAMSIAVAVQWIMNYTVSSTFPLLDRSTWLVEKFNHSISFWLFGIMAFLSFLFVWKLVPETKGKSLEEMEKIWK
ncbi:D-xylose transporter XylE [Labilibacter sediminis]|nr:D-xylose transporter XylE [Labilibacter sediminis]